MSRRRKTNNPLTRITKSELNLLLKNAKLESPFESSSPSTMSSGMVSPRGQASVLPLILGNLESIQESFYFLDKSQKGWVKKVELQMVLARDEIPISDFELDEIFDKYGSADQFKYPDFLGALGVTKEQSGIQIPSIQKQIREVIEKKRHSPTMLFLAFDVNKNGRVSAQEIRQYLLANGVSVSMNEVVDFVKNITSDSRGLTYNQFCQLFIEEQPAAKPEVHKTEIYDLASILLQKQSELKDKIKEADLDNIGQIDRNSFVNIVFRSNGFINSREAEKVYELLKNPETSLLNYRELPTRLEDLLKSSNLPLESSEVLLHFKQELFEETDSMVRTLRRADVDRDGRINSKEFSQMIRKSGLVVEENSLSKIYDIMDTDKTNSLSIQDIIKFIQQSVWQP